MNPKPAYEDIRDEIQEEIDHFGGSIPERVALVWHGYLASLIIWELISVREHGLLVAMLPRLDDNPAIALLTGRPDDDA